MSTILYLAEARQHTLSAGPKHLMRLVPGRNVIDDELYEAVLNSGTKDKETGKKGVSRLQQMIDDGEVKVIGQTVNITKMSAPEAIEMIELETTEEGLNDLLGQENGSKKPRKSVVKAIEDKIEAIRQAPPPDETETEE